MLPWITSEIRPVISFFGWFLKCQRAGGMAGGADAGIRCSLLLASPKREYLEFHQKFAIYFIALFSCTYLKEDI